MPRVVKVPRVVKPWSIWIRRSIDRTALRPSNSLVEAIKPWSSQILEHTDRHGRAPVLPGHGRPGCGPARTHGSSSCPLYPVGTVKFIHSQVLLQILAANLVESGGSSSPMDGEKMDTRPPTKTAPMDLGPSVELFFFSLL